MRNNDFQNTFKGLMLQSKQDLRRHSAPLTAVIHGDNVSATDRLGVYHNNIIGSLCDALCASFPMIENLVGEDFFRQMAKAFIFENPPKNGCLHFYGAGFDGFTKEYAPAADLPYLPDVARFEIAVQHAYYAQDDEAMRADYLAQIPPDLLGECLLELRQSVTLIRSPYPLIALREFYLNNGAPPDLSLKGDFHIMVYRPELEVIFIKLRPDEYAFLTHLQIQNLGNALEKTVEDFPCFDFTAFLQRHITLQSFCVKNALD